jgi:TolB-like protein
MIGLLLITGIIQGQNTQPRTLAVGDLVAQGIKQSEAAIISDQLRFELSRSKQIRLIERSQMQEILKEQGFQQSGCTSDACAVEVGQLLGVKNMIIGTVGKAGSYTVLTVRVLDVATAEIIANESVRTRGGIDKVLESGIAEASNKLQSSLFGADIHQVQRKSSGPRKALLLTGGGALLVGGGIAAIMLLTGDNPPEKNEPNIRIDLP